MLSLLLLCLLGVPFSSSSSPCPGSSIETIVVSSPTISYRLPTGGFGSDVAWGGANVMVAFTESSSDYAYTMMSFDFGFTFPLYGKRTMMRQTSSLFKMDLVTDGQTFLAVGKMDGKLQHMRFSMGDLTWKNGSVMFDSVPSFVSCAARHDVFVCALGNTPVIPEGMQIFSLSLANSSVVAYTPTWVRRQWQDAIQAQNQIGIATDGRGFMVCSAGVVSTTSCGYSTDGLRDYTTTKNKPILGTVSPGVPFTMSSTGVNGSFVLAYVRAGLLRTVLTFNAGDTAWIAGIAVPFSGSVNIFPHALFMTNKLVAAQISSGTLKLVAQNNSIPLQFSTPISWTSETALDLSIAPGDYGANFVAAYSVVNGVGTTIKIKSCVPTAAPTISPTVLSTTSDASNVILFHSVAMAVLAMTAIAM